MENLMSFIHFTKIKKKILTQMSILDANNQIDSDQYIELLNNYKLVCEVYDKKLCQLTEDERKELISKIQLLNPKLLQILPFEKILYQEDNYDVITRVILDISNFSLMKIYSGKNSGKEIFNRMLNYFGIEIDSEEEKINNTLVNEYMNQDFINQLFLNFKNKVNQEKNPELKQTLCSWKYQLILLSSSLENRALLTNFSIPETTKLIDKITIETTGISLEQYTQELDYAIIDNIFRILKKISFLNETKELYLYMVIFDTLVDLLSSKNSLNSIKNELEDYLDGDLPIEISERLSNLLEKLEEKQNNNTNNINKRKYIRI